MGLLGDADSQANFALAAGLLGGGNFGQAFGRGLAGYQATLNQDADRKMQEAYRRAQMLQIEQAMQQSQAQAAAMQHQRDLMVRLANDPNPDYRQYIANGLDPKVAESLASAPNLGKPKVARTLKGIGPDGREYEYQVDEQGNRIGEGLPQFRAPLSVNQGNQTTFADPYTRKPVGAFQINQSPDSIASTAVSIRGQNMADARAREANAANLSKPFEVTGPDGTPVLVQQDKAGNITPVQGYSAKSATKPLTDAQAKAALFGARMSAANAILDEVAQSGTEISVPGSRSGFGVGAVISALSPESNQRLDQAKRDFINAVLRRESGAVISAPEFDNAEKQYFPQVGDSKAVIEQKRENRRLAERGILAEIPKNQRGVVDEITGTPDKPARPQKFNMLPPAKDFAGKRMKADDGTVYRSNGASWVKE